MSSVPLGAVAKGSYNIVSDDPFNHPASPSSLLLYSTEAPLLMVPFVIDLCRDTLLY